MQSTCYPDNFNCASISFVADIRLINGSKVYIAGFSGVQTLTSNISLTCADGQCTDVAYEFDVHRKLITLAYNQPVLAHTEQTVKVCFLNPSTAQRAPELSIWASNLCGCVIRIPKEIIQYPTKDCVAVLAVAPPSFLNAKITQCHPYVGAMNIITATVSANVPLQRPHKVTISGLVGSQTPDSKALPVYDGKFGDCENGCSMTRSNIFESTGRWSKDRGMLVLELKENVITCLETFI
jgi:hypothetical protein